MAKKIKIIQQMDKWYPFITIISSWKYRESLINKIRKLKLVRICALHYLYYIRFLKDEEENEI
jgi:hypothetical protein